MADTVIDFPENASNGEPVSLPRGTGFGGRIETSKPVPHGTVRTKYSGGTVPPASIDIDKLYPAEREPLSDVVAALGLLGDAVALLEKARVSVRENRFIDADRETQRFQVLLPQLFLRRKIGDGFASLINSIHFALINQHGTPLTFDQLTTVWRVMKELRNAPFTTFDQSLKFVEELEDRKLRVDPPALTNLIEDFESE